MNREELEAKFAVKFPKVQKDKTEVKNYLTLRLAGPGDLHPVISWLKDDLDFASLHMVTAVDWLGGMEMRGYISDPNFNVFRPDGTTADITPPGKKPNVDYRDKFEMIYSLAHLGGRLMVFLKVDVPRDGGRVPSIVKFFPSADWQEREIFDLYGVEFTGHPNLKKILTPDFMEGNPLRKDYIHKKDRFD